jgi:hypothetical protein
VELKREEARNLLAGWLALGQLNSTGDGTSMEPAIAVHAEGLAGILLELGGAVDGLEQREEACVAYEREGHLQYWGREHT